MFKIFSAIALILFILLTPLAILALISQNALPGDPSYSIKRTLEDGVLVFASITPVTKTWFAVARSERRFDEASILLNRGTIPSQILDELVIQTDVAANEIKQINDVKVKKRYITELSSLIDHYDQRLVLAREQFASTPPLSPPPTSPVQITVGQTGTVIPITGYTPPDNTNQRQLEEYRRKLEGIKRQLKLEEQRLPTPTPVPTAKSVIPTRAPAQLIQFVFTPTPTPTAVPTFHKTSKPSDSSEQDSSVVCYDNYPEVTYQTSSDSDFLYYWKSYCSKTCSKNSDCEKNTSDLNINPSTSNWCYGDRCYMLETRSR